MSRLKVLLVTPPMTQVNTPYPATAYLTGFLRGQGVSVVQADPALELVLRLLSHAGLRRVLAGLSDSRHESVEFFRERAQDYLDTVEPVIKFLQGRDPSLAYRIQTRAFLPEGPRFAAIAQAGLAGRDWGRSAIVQGGEEEIGGDELDWAFGRLGLQDRAKYLATLYVDDLVDVIREGIDPRFELSRYGEKLAASQASFEPLLGSLRGKKTLVDTLIEEITDELMDLHRPSMVGFSVPFPGNVYGAFRMAARVRERFPEVSRVLGGGYVNTELRRLEDPRVFEFFDEVMLDDGERPILTLIEALQGKREANCRVRTLRLDQSGRVVLINNTSLHDIPHRDAGTPTYDGLRLGDYLQVFELLNPMHRIWSDGRWNKLTLSHGCYWRKCNFCDVTLDYIGRYDPASADLLVDRICALVEETGNRGFHFVDEAAPPALLRSLAERLIERKVVITWWGNIRFEKTFDQALTDLLAQSGCIAVSGGLEVASDRLLKLMNKGVSVEQVARVTHAFAQSGIFVHAYLMYGVPTQTAQETVDALERVRQLFEAGCVHSGFWHRFSVTAHSPIGKDPEKFGLELKIKRDPGVPLFAENDVPFEDRVRTDHDLLGEGLKKALYNYMHGVGLDRDVRTWFKGKKLGKANVDANLIYKALKSER